MKRLKEVLFDLEFATPVVDSFGGPRTCCYRRLPTTVQLPTSCRATGGGFVVVPSQMLALQSLFILQLEIASK